MRHRMGDLSDEHGKFLHLPVGQRELRKRRIVVGGMDQFRPPVLADPDAGSRVLDPPAANTSPCGQALRHPGFLSIRGRVSTGQ